VVKKHWYWDNWVPLALTAGTCFMGANVIISYLSSYGTGSLFYFCGGAVIYSFVYFLIMSRYENKGRVLLHTDGKFDFSLLMCYVGGALFGTSVFYAISYTFKFCALSGLNIGVAQTIWCFTPAIASVFDFFLYGNGLKGFHYVGLIAMLCAGSCIALSNLFHEVASVAVNIEHPMPIYVPVLTSMLLPIIFCCFAMYTKWVFTVKKINPLDFTFGYFLIFKLAALLGSIWYF